MDLTDITITPMIPMGAFGVPLIIKSLTGWSGLVSFAVGIVPGVMLGFVTGLLLFWSISWVLRRVFGHRVRKD